MIHGLEAASGEGDGVRRKFGPFAGWRPCGEDGGGGRGRERGRGGLRRTSKDRTEEEEDEKEVG